MRDPKERLRDILEAIARIDQYAAQARDAFCVSVSLRQLPKRPFPCSQPTAAPLCFPAGSTPQGRAAPSLRRGPQVHGEWWRSDMLDARAVRQQHRGRLSSRSRTRVGRTTSPLSEGETSRTRCRG